MKVVVIIPTYNERENTTTMIDTLAKVFAEIKDHQMNLLYVDGNSPDGTAEIIKSKQKKYKWLHLLVETKKEGLGMAYAKGMKYAMEKLKADYLMEFDGDFQHRPDDIPRLVAEIENNYDLIIGSRYIKGGSIPKQWGLDRKFLSVVGNLVARVCLLTPQIHDVTGGFRLSRAKGFMDQFDFNKLISRSFAYKVHTLFFMLNRGAKVKEVAIKFQHRTSGESKIIKNEMFETLRVIFKLQSQNPKITRFLKFATVGFIGYVINAVGLEVFFRLGLPAGFAASLGAELAIISNFTLNNLWTFAEKKITSLGQILVKFIQFNLTSLGAVVLQGIVVAAGTAIIGNQYRQIVLIIAVGFFVLPYNYVAYNLLIWRTWKLPKFS